MGCLDSLMLSKVNLDIVYIISRHFVILRVPVLLGRPPCVPYQSRKCCPSAYPAASFASNSFPVLLDVERPLELQMCVVVIVDELGDSLVVATAEHAGGGGFGLDCRYRQRGYVYAASSYTYTSSRSMASPQCWDHKSPIMLLASILTAIVSCQCLPSSPASCC